MTSTVSTNRSCRLSKATGLALLQHLFRLITYRFFKFKRDAPQQLFSDAVHEAVPGSPQELSRSCVLENTLHEIQAPDRAPATGGSGHDENPPVIADLADACCLYENLRMAKSLSRQ